MFQQTCFRLACWLAQKAKRVVARHPPVRTAPGSGLACCGCRDGDTVTGDWPQQFSQAVSATWFGSLKKAELQKEMKTLGQAQGGARWGLKQGHSVPRLPRPGLSRASGALEIVEPRGDTGSEPPVQCSGHCTPHLCRDPPGHLGAVTVPLCPQRCAGDCCSDHNPPAIHTPREAGRCLLFCREGKGCSEKCNDLVLARSPSMWQEEDLDPGRLDSPALRLPPLKETGQGGHQGPGARHTRCESRPCRFVVVLPCSGHSAARASLSSSEKGE
nr:uncharacterized protein LOC109729874 [Microcebus murinus]